MRISLSGSAFPTLHRLLHRNGQRLRFGNGGICWEGEELSRPFRAGTFFSFSCFVTTYDTISPNPFPTDRFPDANHLLDNRSCIPSRSHLPYPLPHRYILWSSKLPPPPSHGRRHGFRRCALWEVTRCGKPYHGCRAGVPGVYVVGVPDLVCGFWGQNAEADEKDGRRGVGSYAQGLTG